MSTRRGTTNRNARGSSYDRRARRHWLLDTFGDGSTAPCYRCGEQLTDRTITVDRIVPGKFGGKYVRGNIRPACALCNSETGGRLVAETVTPRIGSLCTGYGGLDMATQAVFGGEHVWMAENDPHASKVLVHHWPAVPNLGDITAVDWADVEPVDIVAAGFPCTNISNAGPRDGINGKDSRVWKNVAEAVRVLRPKLVILENVTAIRSRGLDVAAADLAAIGYDAIWHCLRASDVGAPHQRDRWFALAYPATEDADSAARQQRWTAAAGEAEGGRARPASGGRGGVPASAAGVALLPTPAARDWRSGASNLLGTNSRPLNEVVVNLLPTPKASDGPHGGPNQRDTSGRYYLPGITVRLNNRWVAVDGTDYGPAVRRWEEITGYPAPCPTEPGMRSNRRLSPRFAEWMMGLPPGHVTAVPGVHRNNQIRIIGGGVVPQQGAHALSGLLAAYQTDTLRDAA